MYQTYKPSGKVSWVFFPLLILFLFLVIPSAGFLYVFVAWNCPSVIVNGILYLVLLFLLALFGCRICIRVGKVRNLPLAGLSGVLAGGMLFYALSVCFYLFTEGTPSPERLFRLLLHPAGLPEAWSGLVQNGFAVTTVKGFRLFTLKGGFLIAALVIVLLLTMFALAAAYIDTAWFPFCETSKKWAASRTIYLEYIEDKDLFIKKLAFGDTSLLLQLETLKSINCSHCEAELYIANQDSEFYVTMNNKRKAAGKTEDDGTVKFEEEEITELLKLDSQTGRILLARAANAPQQASAKVITRESGKDKALSIIRMTAAAAIQLGLLVLYFTDLEFARVFFTNGIALFYIIINLVVFSISLLGCFIKEDVMIRDENQLYFNDTKRYQMQRWDSPLIHKIYYCVMVLTSLLLLILCIRRNL